MKMEWLWTFVPSIFIKDPIIGEKWIFLDESGNPFSNKSFTVIIDDVKHGWVKYIYESSQMPNSMKCSMFKHIYQKRYK